MLICCQLKHLAKKNIYLKTQFNIFYNCIGDGEILLVVRGYGTFAMGGVLRFMNIS